MKKIKLLVSIGVLCAGLLFSTNVFANDNINRLSGQDRYETSSKIVSKGWTQSDYAILVNGENYPDALSASPLAKSYNCPILLTTRDSLTDITKQKLEELRVKHVFIIGGLGSISNDVENILNSMNIEVERVWGQDRYETSLNVAKRMGINANIVGAFVVSGDEFKDALITAPLAARVSNPIILIPSNSVPKETKEYLDGIKAKQYGKVFVVGGSDVLSNDVVSEINPTTLFNDETVQKRNLSLIEQFRTTFNNGVYLASDSGFADALSGGVLAAKDGYPVILVGNDNHDMIKNFISKNNMSNVNVLGGTGVVSDSVVGNITNGMANSNNVNNSNNTTNSNNGNTTINGNNNSINNGNIINIINGNNGVNQNQQQVSNDEYEEKKRLKQSILNEMEEISQNYPVYIGSKYDYDNEISNLTTKLGNLQSELNDWKRDDSIFSKSKIQSLTNTITETQEEINRLQISWNAKVKYENLEEQLDQLR